MRIFIHHLNQYSPRLFVLAAVLAAGSAKADMLIMPDGWGQEWGEGPTGQFTVLLNPRTPVTDDNTDDNAWRAPAGPTIAFPDVVYTPAIVVAPYVLLKDPTHAGNGSAPAGSGAQTPQGIDNASGVSANVGGGGAGANVASSGDSTMAPGPSTVSLGQAPFNAGLSAPDSSAVVGEIVDIDPPAGLSAASGQAVTPEPPVWAMLGLGALLLRFAQRRPGAQQR